MRERLRLLMRCLSDAFVAMLPPPCRFHIEPSCREMPPLRCRAYRLMHGHFERHAMLAPLFAVMMPLICLFDDSAAMIIVAPPLRYERVRAAAPLMAMLPLRMPMPALLAARLLFEARRYLYAFAIIFCFT